MNNKDSKLWTFHQMDNAENLIMGNPRQDMLFRRVNGLVKHGKILEIGFGNGYLLKKMSNKFDCYGADISIENVEQMKERIPGVKFDAIEADGKLPYESNYFDVFVASEVLEHMTDSELDLSVKEIYRVLKDGGYAIITFPVNEKLKNSECFCPNCSEVFHRWGHKQSWNKKKINNKFSNFKVKEIKEFFTPHKGNSMFENFAGFMMFVLRTILNKFVSIPNKNYLVIIRK